MKKDKCQNYKIYLSIFLLVLADIITKYIFTNSIFFNDFFISINYTKNYGSSLGIFANVFYYNILIIILSTIILFFLIYSKKYFTRNKFLKIAYILFISGIIGNGYDRLIFGYVRDYIALKYLFVFNLADLYLTLAFIAYIIYEYKYSNFKK